jgi:hypothetical protein
VLLWLRLVQTKLAEVASYFGCKLLLVLLPLLVGFLVLLDEVH